MIMVFNDKNIDDSDNGRISNNNNDSSNKVDLQTEQHEGKKERRKQTNKQTKLT